MSDFKKHLDSSLKDPEFKTEWDSQSVEREVMRQIVAARFCLAKVSKAILKSNL